MHYDMIWNGVILHKIVDNFKTAGFGGMMSGLEILARIRESILSEILPLQILQESK